MGKTLVAGRVAANVRKRNAAVKKGLRARPFDPAEFLETTAKGRTMATHPKREVIFAQGDAADAVFYVKKAKSK